ncbi:tetratricopeptide repeat protein [Kitasatospora sp. NBC_00070]|uniref:tetratricopeptide repeat protein n=1 Tax=Kitasatospora sp. NBC_00070 TaxID=2975962 RepID=UPI00324E92B3
MLDPLSISAVTAVLGAVGASMANEAGRWAWESVGGLTRRAFGREVPAPTGAAEREQLAGRLVARAQADPAFALELSAWLNGNAGAGTYRPAVPRALPASVRFFTDRREALKQLDQEADRKPDGRPRVAVLHGPEGIGTSTLAVHWGAREIRRFPDGQLYLDLRGGALGTSPTPTALLRRLLLDLGMPADTVPLGLDDRLTAYRTALADRRLLLVLDHAQSAAQVLPLVTSAPGVCTVVVARRPLTGLDAVGVPVGPLSGKDATRLLTELAGRQAVGAAKATLPALLARCAGSPFALRAAAPYLATVPAPRVGEADAAQVAVEDAYGRLSPEAARLYRLGGLRPWAAIGPELAHAVGEFADAGELLAELAEQRLLEPQRDGRYRYRPMVRAHAEQAAVRQDGLAAGAAAVRRAVESLLHFAVRADHAALPQRWHLGPLYRELGRGEYESPGAAVAALSGELGNLLEAVRAAGEFGWHDLVCQLVEALWALQLKAAGHDLLLPALRAGVRSAEAFAPGTDLAGRMHTQLSFALVESKKYDEAETELMAAAEADRAAGHLRGQATAVESLGLLRLRQWRFTEAYDCFEEADRLLGGITEGDRGRADVPRARALLRRHRGRALASEPARAVEQLELALSWFREHGDDYNTARTLTNLAEARLAQGRPAEAAVAIEEALVLLGRENAALHLPFLHALRERASA